MDAIGKLTGGIAHDFNNLLAAVLGGIGLIERRLPVTEDQRKILTLTRHAAEQGADLISRLLAFSRRQALEPVLIDIDKLASSVRGLLSHTLGGLVDLQWSVEEGVWSPYADTAQLELALMNLVINARDAMPEGGVVSVSMANHTLDASDPRLSAGDYVVIAVKDEGTGIAPEMIERVLEPFYTTKPIGKGTGLGLSMVYGFAKQSGGMLSIDSVVGQGTVIELWLPRALEEVTSPSLPSDARPRPCSRTSVMTSSIWATHRARSSCCAAALSICSSPTTRCPISRAPNSFGAHAK